MSFVTNNSIVPTNAKLYYTVGSTTFATTTQVGATVVAPNGTITFNFTQLTGSGSYYYWLAYDIPAGAGNCETFDASFATNGLTYGNSCPGASSATPTTPNPAGNRAIEASGCWKYCAVNGTTATPGYLQNVTLSTINRTSGFDGYINTGLSTTLAPSQTINLSL